MSCRKNDAESDDSDSDGDPLTSSRTESSNQLETAKVKHTSSKYNVQLFLLSSLREIEYLAKFAFIQIFWKDRSQQPIPTTSLYHHYGSQSIMYNIRVQSPCFFQQCFYPWLL